VITEEMGLKLENTEALAARPRRKVVVDKDSTTIIDGAASPTRSRPASSSRPRSRPPTPTSTREAQERLAKLSGSVAVVKVGAATETG
jgi:chaperonin GroEL